MMFLFIFNYVLSTKSSFSVSFLHPSSISRSDSVIFIATLRSLRLEEKGEKRRRNKSFVYGKKINDC